jgi:aspartate aminotransferase-like enzyme
MMSEAAQEKLKDSVSTSFACDLAKWLWIMKAYENGSHAYHATMPTDALVTFSDVMADAQNIGFDILHKRQQELGDRIRDLLANNGIKSVAADGFDAPGVVVSYINNPGIQNGSQFVEQGIQIAAGVPLMCNEPEGFSTFRLGLFGLDKLNNIDRTVTVFGKALDQILA